MERSWWRSLQRPFITILSKTELLTASGSREVNFVYLVVSASCVILDSASWACAKLSTTSGVAQLHNKAVQELLYILVTMHVGQAPALRGLRATTCSPAAVTGCIERLFAEDGWDPSHGEDAQGRQLPLLKWMSGVSEQLSTRDHKDGQLSPLALAGAPTCDNGSCFSAVHLFTPSAAYSLFAPERAAIAADARLQARIVARAAGNLRAFCQEAGLSSGDFDTLLGGCNSVIKEGGLASLELDTYRGVASALRLLATAEFGAQMAVATQTVVQGGFQFMEVLIVSTGLFLRLDPPAELGAHWLHHHLADLTAALRALDRASMSGPAQLAFRDSRRCLALATAVGIRVLETEGADSELLPLAARDIAQLMEPVVNPELPASDQVPRAADFSSWAPHYQALEGMLRLACLLPAGRPGEPHDPEAETALQILRGCLGGCFVTVHDSKPSAPPEEAEAWSAHAWLVDGATKFALRLGAEGAPEDKHTCLSAMVSRVALFHEALEGREQEEGFPLR